MPLREVERAVSNHQTQGLVKLLVDERGYLLGKHILASRADDLLAPIILAMHANLSVDALATAIQSYPTLSETVRRITTRIK